MRGSMKVGLSVVCGLVMAWGIAGAQEAKDAKNQPIQAAEVKLGRPVDFERDVYPILDSKCLACHNVAIAENGLNLEDVKGILKGGKRGTSIAAKDPEKSLLFKLASRGATPAMPPLPNKVEATALTPQELGIIKQWILEGANAGMGSGGNVVQWKPLPKGIHPIYSVALTADGQYAAAGRGNKISIFHVPTAQEVASLADPALMGIQYEGKPMYDPGSSHRDYVQSLAFSPNGNILASGSYREVKLWARAESSARLNLAASTAAVPAVAVSADDKTIAVAAVDNTIKVYNNADGAAGKVLAGHTAAVTSLKFSADGTKLYSSSQDKSIRVWTVADGAAAGRIDLPAAVNGIVLTADGAKLVAACADNMVRVFVTPGATATLASAAAPVPAIRVSPDKKLLALAGADGKITLIDLATGKPTKELAGHTAAVSSVAFSANSAKLVSGGADKTVRVWDIATGAAVVIANGIPNPVTAVAFRPDMAQVAAGFSDGNVSLYKSDADAAPEKMLPAFTKPISGLVYSNDGAGVIAASEDGNLRRHKTADAAQEWAQGHGAAINDLALSADGQLLATAGENNQVRLWNPANGGAGPKPSLDGLPAPVKSVAFSLDNAHIACGTANNLVLVYDAKTGLVEQINGEHAGAIEALAAAGENGKTFVSSSGDKSVKSWALVFDRQIAGHGGPVTAIALVPQPANQVVTGSDDQTVRVWDITNGNAVRTMNHGGQVTGVAASADGQRVASSGVTNTVKIWNNTNAQQIVELKGDYRAIRTAVRAEADVTETKALVTQLMNGIAPADKMVADRTEAQKKALETKTNMEKPVAELTEKVKVAQTAFDTAKVAADGKKDDQGLQKAAADAMKALTDQQAALKKAQDDLATAVKGLADADRNLKEAADAATKIKADHAAATQKQQQQEAALTQAKAAQAGQEKPFRAVAFSKSGKELAAAGDSGVVYTFDGLTGAPLAALDGHKGPVLALAFTGEDELLSGAADQSAKMWELYPQWTLAAVLGPKKEAPLDLNDSVFINRVLSLAFSPDGQFLATGGGDPSRSGEVMIWNVANRAMVRSLENAHSDTVFGLEFSHDGQLILSGAADKFVKIHQVADGKFVKAFEGHTNHVLDVTWRHGDKQIASAGADNAIKVWNVDTGEQLRTVGGYAKQVTSIQFMGRGNNFVSCGGDKTVRFHQSDNGNNFRNFGGGVDFMYAAAGSEDEKVVIAAGQDGVLRVWNGTNGTAIRQFNPDGSVTADNAPAPPPRQGGRRRR